MKMKKVLILSAVLAFLISGCSGIKKLIEKKDTTPPTPAATPTPKPKGWFGGGPSATPTPTPAPSPTASFKSKA